MKKIAKILPVLAVFAFASPSVMYSQKIPEGFVKIPAVSIDGTETWKPESKVFIGGKREIAPFYMSDHEVTRGEYKAVIGSDPSRAPARNKSGKELTGDNAKNNSSTDVSWLDALVYCNTLSIKEGLTPCYAIGGETDPAKWKRTPWGDTPNVYDREFYDWTSGAQCDFSADGYRLPTEAEWEWAARGGESYTYAGSEKADKVAWYGYLFDALLGSDCGGTRDVKTKKPNGYGLYDMSGNVSEWCWSYNSDGAHGGSWADVPECCTVSYIDYAVEKHRRYGTVGFRVVRTAK